MALKTEALKQETKIQVLIADDHPIVRLGLKNLFSRMGGISVAGEAAAGLDVLSMLRQESRFDLLLLDLGMPDCNEFDLIARIHSQHSSLPILVFSMNNETLIVKRAFQVGASGFISKGCAQNTLMSAIRKVAAGERFIDPMLAAEIIFEKTDTSKVPHCMLSERELLIMKLLAQGKTGNEIAGNLSISKKTVSTHKVRLMQKMNFQNMTELVLYAANYALIN